MGELFLPSVEIGQHSAAFTGSECQQSNQEKIATENSYRENSNNNNENNLTTDIHNHK